MGFSHHFIAKKSRYPLSYKDSCAIFDKEMMRLTVFVSSFLDHSKMT